MTVASVHTEHAGCPLGRIHCDILKAMKGIEAGVTMDSEASALHLEFSGENQEAVRLLLHNLWRNLPFLLNMLGLGSVEELTKPGERREKREET